MVYFKVNVFLLQCVTALLLLRQGRSFVQPCTKRVESILGSTPDEYNDVHFGSLNKDSSFGSGLSPPSKSDIYSSDELMNLLNLHNQIKDTTSKRSTENESPVPPSLHDAVLAALDTAAQDEIATLSNYQITFKMRDILPKIKIIASDVDGTLLTSSHTLHPRTEQAIEAAVQAAKNPNSSLQHFILATGKSRAGALNSLGPKMQALLSQSPGVYIQGLYCVDATGSVVYEKRLPTTALQAALKLATDFDSSLFCYDGDTIMATTSSSDEHITEFHERWGEPTPQRLDDIVQYANGYHKVLLMDSDTDKIKKIRPHLEELAAKHNCVFTQAIDTMLELLPPDSNKAVGVGKLCQALGMSEDELLTVGDGENDVEFLEMAAFSVAMGNGVSRAKQVADVVLKETNNDGGAGVAIELFGLGEILAYE
jgi:Cof subfamily protein (haloacid dehalogenase superfamily)